MIEIYNFHIILQISAAGKTTSLGDHNTEEQAARAFDRAMINKEGREARINFPVEEYDEEFDYLQSMCPTSKGMALVLTFSLLTALLSCRLDPGRTCCYTSQSGTEEWRQIFSLQVWCPEPADSFLMQT